MLHSRHGPSEPPPPPQVPFFLSSSVCTLPPGSLGKSTNLLNMVWFPPRNPLSSFSLLSNTCIPECELWLCFKRRWWAMLTGMYWAPQGTEGLSDGVDRKMTHQVAECQQWGLDFGCVQHGQPGQHNSMQPCWGAYTHTHTHLPLSLSHTHWGGHSWSGSAVYPILRLLRGFHDAGLIAPLNIVQDGRESGTIGMAPLSPAAQKSLLQMPLWKDGSLSTRQAAGGPKINHWI